MTEQEWLTRADPAEMQEHIMHLVSGRKVRLWACACVRQVWHLLGDKRSVAAVEIAERYADGLAAVTSLTAARAAAREAAWNAARNAALDSAWAAAWTVAGIAVWAAAWNAALDSARATAWDVAQAAAGDGAGEAAWNAAWDVARKRQCILLREIIGNPWRPVTLLGMESWYGSSAMYVPSLGQDIYDRRDWGLLPILADALEDAGCDDRTILDHLRGPGPHVRGCWALDLVLGRS